MKTTAKTSSQSNPIIVGLILLLPVVSLISFYLGKMSVSQPGKSHLQTEKQSANTSRPVFAEHKKLKLIAQNQDGKTSIMELDIVNSPTVMSMLVDGVFYEVRALHASSGKCRDGTENCPVGTISKKEQPLPNSEGINLWSDAKGVYALNTMSLGNDDFTTDVIWITKHNKESFTEAEITHWKEILSTAELI